MDPLTAAIGAAAPHLVSGLTNKLFGGGDDPAAAQKKFARKMIKKERKFFLKDRRNERAYTENLTNRDRNYAEGLRDNEREYSEARRDQDMADYMKDRWKVQKMADNRAEMTAASRGIDFQKLRDDAIAAGFNPLTAMHMAGAYSTERNFQSVAAPYTGGGNFMPAAGAVMPSTAAAPSSFSMNGAGYASTIGPSLSSGNFIGDAIAAGVDTYFNTPSQVDQEAASIKAQQAAYQAGQLSVPSTFGYDNVKQAPYAPSTSIGESTFGAPPYSEGQLQIGGIPIERANVSNAEDFETRGGDVAGSIVGLGITMADAGLTAKREWDEWTASNADKPTLRGRWEELTGKPLIPHATPGAGSFYLDTGVTPYVPPIRPAWYGEPRPLASVHHSQR